MLVGSTIGSGIFRTPAGVTDKLPGPLPLMTVWIAGGLFALCGALTLAELTGAFPETGGAYVYIREGWGRLPAFLFGWSELTLIRAASLGAGKTSPALRITASSTPKTPPPALSAVTATLRSSSVFKWFLSEPGTAAMKVVSLSTRA